MKILQGPVIIAHRGGSLEAPENTLASFRHAIDVGAKFVELDVHLSRDGEVVVIHDEVLGRTTTGSGLVGAHTFDELRKLDAGSHFSPEFAGEKIPSLREVLDLCSEADVGVFIELKSPSIYPGIVDKVAALLGEMWIRGIENIWCKSFDHNAVRQLRALDPLVPLGYLYTRAQMQFVDADDTVQFHCPFFRTPIDHPEQVAEAHRMGKFVTVYTVNEEEDLLRLADIGIDGMVTDRPSALLPLLNTR